MIFDHSPQRGRPEDQAEGLRQLRRIDAPHGRGPGAENQSSSSTYHSSPGSQSAAPSGVSGNASQAGLGSLAGGPAMRVLDWPRVVLISEHPSSDVGARFAFHLACALGRDHISSGISSSKPNGPHNLLVDLAPAASRLPGVLADLVPATAYHSLWSGLAAGKALAPAELGTRFALSIAAEPQAVPCPIDQLPRVYEQLVRAISRHSDRYRWIVMLGLDGVVPLDRACWQAADDIVLVDNDELSGCARQAAAMRNRIDEHDPQRTLWTLPKRVRWTERFSPGWLSSRRLVAATTRWMEAGVACKTLPAVGWPERCHALSLREGSRVDSSLKRSAWRVAERLRLAAAGHDGQEMSKFEGSSKKIQLDMHTRTINGVTDEFCA